MSSRHPATVPAEQSTCFDGPLQDYLDHLRIEKRSSPHTLDAVRRDVSAFAEYAARAGVDILAAIDTHLLRAYVAARHREGLSAASLQRALSSLRGFLRHQLSLGRLAANPAQAVRAPRHRRRLPAVIAAETLNDALDRSQSALDTNAPLALRDLAMIELFYSAGLRLAELQTLDCRAVAHGQTEITILGKGSKQRRVLIGGPARRLLDAWLQARPTLLAAGRTDSGALFIARGGARLSRTSIGARLKHWALRSGLGSHLHPHRLRHSFATHLLESSGDLRAVQELLGHAHLSTTQIYTQLDWKRLAQVYDDAHPRARRKKTPD